MMNKYFENKQKMLEPKFKTTAHVNIDEELEELLPKPNNNEKVITAVALKFDDNKRDWSLLPIDAVEEVIKVLEFGRNKYAAWNWSSNGGFKYMRVVSALLRHLFAWMRGEDNDPETGLSHIAHVACNVLFLLHFIVNKKKYIDNDDRPL